MAKYIENSSGSLKEVQPISSSVGAGDANKMIQLDSTGKLDTSFMPTGIGADTVSITASEDLAAGDFVNIWDSGGAKVRKADATTAGKEAHGFVLAAVTAPAAATVYFEGSNNQVSGATVGPQFLSTTAGTATATAPSGSGNIVQRIGIATSATNINVEFGQPIELI